MITQNEPEYWQSGPVNGIPPLLQPVAHALLQARREVYALITGFRDQLLWLKPAGMASPGFHLQHLSGVIDRLFTYAKALPLSEAQFTYLKLEGNETAGVTTAELMRRFDETIDAALSQLEHTPESTLTEARTIGRKKLPTTVIGLLFHAAEHTQRHVGQLLVTVAILKDQDSGKA